MGVDKFSWVTERCDFPYLAGSPFESVIGFDVSLKYVQLQLSGR
jgi:hypothetical protein